MEPLTDTATIAAEPAVETPTELDGVHVGERVSDRYNAEEAAAEPAGEAVEVEQPQPTEPERSPEYEAGFEAALEQLAEYDRYEADLRQREEMYEQIGEEAGLTGPQVQQIFEEQARRDLAARQTQQIVSAETQQRLAHIGQQREAILDHSLATLAENLGSFDRDDVVAGARELMADPEFVAEVGPHAAETALYLAAEQSVEQIAEGNARVGELIERANRYIGADPEAVRRAADRVFDTSAPDQGAELARAITEGFYANPTPVRFGTRVTDTYAAVQQLHNELADRTPPPRQERQVQLARDSAGRFTRVERVTDRAIRQAWEGEQEQRRLAAHKERMKGLQ